MIFISVEDFLTKANTIPRLNRSEERALAIRMIDGDDEAKKKLIYSYLPSVAFHVRRAPENIRTLNTVYACIDALEKAIDRFDFLQDSETFAHHLSWCLRQCITKCIANRL